MTDDIERVEALQRALDSATADLRSAERALQRRTEERNKFAAALRTPKPEASQADDGDRDGYVDAYYEITSLLGIGAQPLSPKRVHENLVMPSLRRLVAQSIGRTPEASQAEPIEELVNFHPTPPDETVSEAMIEAGEEQWQPRIGEKVIVSSTKAWASDWVDAAGQPLVVTVSAITAEPGGYLDVTVSEEWPLPQRHAFSGGGQTDGFIVGRSGDVDDIRPLAMRQASKGEG